MGGSAPSAPTLDVGKSTQLTRADYELKQEFTPKLTEAAGEASRSEYGKNLEFALKQLGDRTIGERYEQFLPEEARRRRTLLDQLDAGMGPGAEYTRLQEQMQGSVGERAGMLTAEQQREAVQGARSAMAARGMATGNAGVAAELLNRDRYMQQRRAQDLGILGQSAGFADQERMRQLGVRQDAYNFALGSNPNMMAVGLGSGYANMTQPAMGLMGGQNVQPMYSGGQFSSGGGMGGNMGMAAGGALTGAATGAMMGAAAGGIGAVPGAIIGGLAGGASGYLSDKRTKTDIKLLGKVTSLLDLPAYEYRYKGEKKKRKGVMAQDVQKVLPEAVTEVDYQGKRRLAIKPSVIGAALAEELTNQTKAVAA
jgi:uncharacterized protein YoaH (UPF0181 family)